MIYRPSDEGDRADRYEAERAAERAREHAPAPAPLPQVSPSPRITRAMRVLAWTVLHGSWHDARDAARVLAELVLEAAETASR